MKHENIIDQLGGSTEVARLCEVTVGAVSQWRKDGIPKARIMFLKAVRPEVFGLPTTEKSLGQPTHPKEPTNA